MDQLTPEVFARWLQAGPWPFIGFFALWFLRRDIAVLFTPRENVGEKFEAALTHVLDETRRQTAILSELNDVMRSVLNELIRGSAR